MSDRKVCELTIMDITERMLKFTIRDEIAEASGYSDYNTGTRDALTQMREDMEKLSEKEFVSKYDEISLEKGDELFELDEETPRAQYLQGYCNTVEDVMSFINPAYIYDQMTMLQEGIEFDEEFEDAFYGGLEHHHHDDDDGECGCGCGHHHHH